MHARQTWFPASQREVDRCASAAHLSPLLTESVMAHRMWDVRDPTLKGWWRRTGYMRRVVWRCGSLLAKCPRSSSGR